MAEGVLRWKMVQCPSIKKLDSGRRKNYIDMLVLDRLWRDGRDNGSGYKSGMYM